MSAGYHAPTHWRRVPETMEKKYTEIYSEIDSL